MHILRIYAYACDWLRLTLELLFGGFVKLLEITHCFWVRDLGGCSWSGSSSVRRESARLETIVWFARRGGQTGGDGVPAPEDTTSSQEHILPKERTDDGTACRAHLTDCLLNCQLSPFVMYTMWGRSGLHVDGAGCDRTEGPQKIPTRGWNYCGHMHIQIIEPNI